MFIGGVDFSFQPVQHPMDFLLIFEAIDGHVMGPNSHQSATVFYRERGSFGVKGITSQSCVQVRQNRTDITIKGGDDIYRFKGKITFRPERYLRR